MLSAPMPDGSLRARPSPACQRHNKTAPVTTARSHHSLSPSARSIRAPLPFESIARRLAPGVENFEARLYPDRYAGLINEIAGHKKNWMLAANRKIRPAREDEMRRTSLW